jgi:hypothetical protein
LIGSPFKQQMGYPAHDLVPLLGISIAEKISSFSLAITTKQLLQQVCLFYARRNLGIKATKIGFSLWWRWGPTHAQFPSSPDGRLPQTRTIPIVFTGVS